MEKGDFVKVLNSTDTSGRGLQDRYGYVKSVEGDDRATVEFNDFEASIEAKDLRVMKVPTPDV